jgi:hypothetical protein
MGRAFCGPRLQNGALFRLLLNNHTMTPTIQAIFPSTRYVPMKVRRFIDYWRKRVPMDPSGITPLRQSDKLSRPQRFN